MLYLQPDVLCLLELGGLEPSLEGVPRRSRHFRHAVLGPVLCCEFAGPPATGPNSRYFSLSQESHELIDPEYLETLDTYSFYIFYMIFQFEYIGYLRTILHELPMLKE